MKNMKNIMTGVYFKGEECFNFKFGTDLSVATRLKYVNSVVEVLIDEYHYNSIIKDLIIDFYIVNIFTDVDTTKLETSQSFLYDVEEFLEETNIVDVVKANMKDGLLDELNRAVDMSIAYRTGIHINPLGEAVANLISTIEKKIREIDLNNISDMANILTNISGDITPESILNAYMNSDIYKNTLNA